MKRSKALIAFMALILAALACSLPRETPPTEPPETPLPPAETEEPDSPTKAPTEPPFACAPGMVAANAFTVEFCYPASLVSGYEPSMIPEKQVDPNMAPWDYNPDMIEIVLQQYPVSNNYHQPIIHIYPVSDYIALEPNVQTTLDNLQALLTSEDPAPAGIPFLPIFNAAQMMQAQVRYLNFRNGHGVRFLTQYGQAYLPINNAGAIYAFMGLTDDGNYFISATLPINHPDFADDDLLEPAEGWDAFIASYETYIADMEAFLETQPMAAFTPDLTFLDDMMTSFWVPSAAIP